MSFFVTLPSNASTQQHHNTQTNYTTDLDTPLTLSVPYEVALVEFAFREYIIIDIGEICIDFGFGTFIPFSLYAYENEPSEHFISRINHDISEYYIIHKIHENQPGSKLDYSNNNTIEIKQWWHDRRKLDPTKSNELYETIRSAHINNIPTLSVLPNSMISLFTIHSVKFKGFCLDLFGLYENRIINANTTLYFNPSILNFYDYLMVYSDVVQYQYVGDTFAPLLRTIFKTGKFNRTTEKIFTSPHYIPVNKSYINSINIDIRDPSGNKVKIASTSSKVLTKLHFRPCTGTN